MKKELISTIKVDKPIQDVWQHWIDPESIKVWNVPFDTWHCPMVENDVKNGGAFNFRMENASTKEGFNYIGVYEHIIPFESIVSTGDDGRKNKVAFQALGNATIICETFEPDTETAIEMQQKFTDAILLNFKKFMERV